MPLDVLGSDRPPTGIIDVVDLPVDRVKDRFFVPVDDGVGVVLEALRDGASLRTGDPHADDPAIQPLGEVDLLVNPVASLRCRGDEDNDRLAPLDRKSVV